LRTLNKLVLVLLVFIPFGAAAWLVRLDGSGSRLDPAQRKVAPMVRLSLNSPTNVVRFSDPAKLRVTVTNQSSNEVFVTTNMDPFVSGTGLLRNYYFTMTGPCKPRVPNRATLNFGFGSFGERDLLNVRAIALLNKNQSYSGELPLETWDTLASQPGKCWIQAHYRGEVPPGEFSSPFVSESLHSNFVEVTITP
jgi:hypothetical protein